MKQKIKLHWPSVLVAVIISILLMSVFGRTSSISSKENVYERIMRTGKIRCGYAVWQPALKKDPNTGKLSGVFYEYMNMMGQRLNLKIEWTEEVGFGEIATALKSNRFDVYCASVWPSASRAREMDFIDPLYYSVVNVYARKGDKRFDNNLESMNSPKTIISTIDGEISSIIADADFPKAKKYEQPVTTTPDMLFIALDTKKADVLFSDTVMANNYIKANPGKLRKVKGMPVRIFGNTMAVKKGEIELQNMLNTASQELLYSGMVDRILKKYEKKPNELIRTKQPY